MHNTVLDKMNRSFQSEGKSFEMDLNSINVTDTSFYSQLPGSSNEKFAPSIPTSNRKLPVRPVRSAHITKPQELFSNLAPGNSLI